MEKLHELKRGSRQQSFWEQFFLQRSRQEISKDATQCSGAKNNRLWNLDPNISLQTHVQKPNSIEEKGLCWPQSEKLRLTFTAPFNLNFLLTLLWYNFLWSFLYIWYLYIYNILQNFFHLILYQYYL